MAGAKNSKQGRQTVFFTAVDPMNEPPTDESYDVKQPGEVLLSNEVESIPECSLLDQPEKCLRQDFVFWQTNSNAIILDKSGAVDCLE